MFRYGLAKVLRGVKALHMRKISAMVLKAYCRKDLQAILKIFEGKLWIELIINKFERKLRNTIK